MKGIVVTCIDFVDLETSSKDEYDELWNGVVQPLHKKGKQYLLSDNTQGTLLLSQYIRHREVYDFFA